MDFSEDSHWAFTYALDLAKTYKANLLIFHVTPQRIATPDLGMFTRA
jgi:nucleotide-binding universal stress UspA family protein